MPEYKRVLLKLSGEALKGGHEDILDNKVLHDFARVMKQVVDLNVQVGIVVGGGNIWRGKLAKSIGVDSATADYMGMLGTIINALAVESALTQVGVEARVMTALETKSVAEPYIWKRAVRKKEKGRIK